MHDITGLEQRCADAWPAVVDVPLGQWRLRAAGGFTGRANSALTTGDPGIPVPEALDRVRDFARRHAIAPAAHVVIGSPAEGAVATAGWRVDLDHPGGAESLVMTGALAGFVTPKHDRDRRGVVVTAEPLPGWWELAAQPDPTPAQRHVLTTGAAVGFGVVVARGPEENEEAKGSAEAGEAKQTGGTDETAGTVLAAVRGAVVGDLLHVARLAVRPGVRRRGLARLLMGGLAAWGAERGATRCALQVAEHNRPAIALYASLGCVEHHRYRYWAPNHA
ncbi:GNAT family N-acetyltransferase [Saccharothrix lopnurensis]|uniref:GNAT family N-acetyltransferase n=1 Tax=Saccharothrix lopnurensis TaxID=1670621 RepID=A0ABW1P933_9PSEU